MARLATKMIKSNNLLLLDVKWYSSTYLTGIIVTEDLTTNEIKCYIDGTQKGQATLTSEIEDATKILHHGAWFPNEAAETIFTDIDFKKGWIRDHPEYTL